MGFFDNILGGGGGSGQGNSSRTIPIPFLPESVE